MSNTDLPPPKNQKTIYKKGVEPICSSCFLSGETSGAETAYPSGAPEFTPGFLVGSVLLDL